jgi:arginine-tRNA-protein transferase
MAPRTLRFRIVYDSPEPCPYREGQVARMPLRIPMAALTGEDFDALLEQGDRRSGPFLYRTTCPRCQACEPIRVPTDRFKPTKSQRRSLKKNDVDVKVSMVEPEYTERHLEIYNRHKLERGLSRSGEEVDEHGYRMHLMESPLDTREIRYEVGGKLIAFSILDFGVDSCSSVYHCFDPDESDRSLGVYSVLKEIELCKQLNVAWYYLGLFVEDCAHLNYKASYFPHQRKANGLWTEFDDKSAPPPPPTKAI